MKSLGVFLKDVFKTVTTSLWKSDNPVQKVYIFWKLLGLLVIVRWMELRLSILLLTCIFMDYVNCVIIFITIVLELCQHHGLRFFYIKITNQQKLVIYLTTCLGFFLLHQKNIHQLAKVSDKLQKIAIWFSLDWL